MLTHELTNLLMNINMHCVSKLVH